MSQIVEFLERDEIPVFPGLEDLPEEDGIPLESPWHRAQINLLIEVLRHRWRDREDFYVGGNMFIYYSEEQSRTLKYRGPDFFLVKDVDGHRPRGKWVVWLEGGRYPDAIVELLSPTTAEDDLGQKKRLYERVFRTSEYFCYDPIERKLLGWRLGEAGYQPLTPDDQSRLWSQELDAWLGVHAGYYQGPDLWLRLFDKEGHLILTEAEAERQRAEAAEVELARLREELARLRGE